MNKCSVSKKPYFICKHLILSKTFFFEVEAYWWVYFKSVSSLSDLHLAKNVDDLLHDITGLVGFCLVLELYESSNNVSDESSEDNEDEESDKISIYFCAVWTRSYSFACYVADFADFWSSGTYCSLLIQASILSCFFCSSASSCALLIRLSSLQYYSWRWRYSFFPFIASL